MFSYIVTISKQVPNKECRLNIEDIIFDTSKSCFSKKQMTFVTRLANYQPKQSWFCFKGKLAFVTTTKLEIQSTKELIYNTPITHPTHPHRK